MSQISTRFFEYLKEADAGQRPMAFAINAPPNTTIEIYELAYEGTPVRFFVDDGTSEALVVNCAVAAHEACRRAGDHVNPWDQLSKDERAAVTELARDILAGRLSDAQAEMREERGALLEGTELPERNRLSALFCAVVELIRAEFDIVRSAAAEKRRARSSEEAGPSPSTSP